MTEEHKTHEEHPKEHAHESEHHEKHGTEHHKQKLEVYSEGSGPKMKKSSLWMGIAAVLAVLLIISFWFNISKGSTGSTSGGAIVLSSDELSKNVTDYINKYVLAGQATAKIDSIKEAEGVYKLYNVVIDINGRKVDSYATADGKLLFPQGIDMTEKPEVPAADATDKTPAQPVETPKTDKPVANAFVMSYCPYGLQFMKAYVPVIELLGSKADVQLNFVNYAMHGEKELIENNRMYCIQKEQKPLLTKYLRCFIESDTAEKCLTDVGVDKTKLDSCVKDLDQKYNITGLYNDKTTWSGGRFPKYPVENDLNVKYGVGGSPTFVVNGKESSVQRSPEAIKTAICGAFNNPPEECKTALSTAAEAPGIGKLGSGSTAAGSDASCG